MSSLILQKFRDRLIAEVLLTRANTVLNWFSLERKTVSFDPDESYYLGEKKEHPDLAIEVTITSGGIDKLEKYKRLKIPEVWFWEKDRLVLYRLRGNDYQKITKSEALPDLDIALLVRCVQMSDLLAARTEFLKGVRKNLE